MTRKAVSIRKKKKSGSRADARKRELLARVSTLLTEASSSEKEPCSEVKLLSCDLSAEDSGPPPKKKLKLSEEEFQKRCLEFQARRKEIMILSPEQGDDGHHPIVPGYKKRTSLSEIGTSRPKVFLVARGLSAELTLTDNARVPILFSDIQSLLLYSQIGDIGPLKPRCDMVEYRPSG
ncbi:unnamed protein product [Cyprideis torosa]|uniref:Uncharacterized protein n=1 Tax=Cyprideis torosa TaxID=163714 RepID=A0A7R8W411_9CRUS|nr:unnamed protein product [Cyprideis torosa]CAG0883616.1 unnamed protein product [Cyprideis torosa]